jgi:pimeloyl-ACP methyl ester carboxylesterase
MRVVFVHGACVRDGAWWWHLTAEVLQARGVASSAPALPSCGESGRSAGAQGPGLSDDVAAVRQLLQSTNEPTVVVVHSYGGIVAAEAAAGIDTVQHLLLISSYLPETGESLSSFGDGSPAPFLDIDAEGGTFGVRPDTLIETFLQDCSDEIGEAAMSHLARQSLSVTQQPVQASAWQQVPTTYLVCTEDRGTPVSAQREFARRAQTAVELKTGHHPFLSQPVAVADLILTLS